MAEVLKTIFISLLSFFLGVPMGITYPFEPHFKILYLVIVALSMIIFLVGLKFRKAKYGKLTLIVSIGVWWTLGLIGLGTGS